MRHKPTYTGHSGTERDIDSPLKLSSSKEPGGQEGVAMPLLTALFDFYDEVLEETERQAKAKGALAGSKILPGLRYKMTPEAFRVTSKPVLTLMQRLETATLQPLPT